MTSIAPSRAKSKRRARRIAARGALNPVSELYANGQRDEKVRRNQERAGRPRVVRRDKDRVRLVTRGHSFRGKGRLKTW